MQSQKEIYFTAAHIDAEVTRLKVEIGSFPVRKKEWAADFSKTALIVTDMQQYFLSPESHAFIPSAQAIIPSIKLLIEFFRKAGRTIIFTRHINNPEDAGSMAWWWNDLIEETSPLSSLSEKMDPGKDLVLIKHQYDAFYGTGLKDILQSSDSRHLVICGVMANLCCETTARSAFVNGFRPVVPLDATAAYNRELHLATFRNLAFGFSPLLTTEEVIKALKP